MKYNSIPKTRELGSELIRALGMTFPNAIPNRGITVATIKKLNVKRKKWAGAPFTMSYFA